MRILFLNHNAGSPSHGPNLRTYYLGQACAAAGHSVDVLSSSFFHKYTQPPKARDAITYERLGGVDYYWLRTRPYRNRGIGQVQNQLQYIFRCFQYRQTWLKIGYDVVIASSPHPFTALPGYHFAQRMKVPFVFEVRDIWPEALQQLGGYRSIHPYIMALAVAERYAMRRANLIISVKPGDKSRFSKRFGISGKKLAYIPNGIDVALFDKQLEASSPVSPEQTTLVVGYVGALSKAYDLDSLIEAAEILEDRDSDIEFRIAGTGSDYERLSDLVAEKRLRSVQFMGVVRADRIPDFLRNCDVGYIGIRKAEVYRRGISSNKLFEYMAARCPILAAYDTAFDPVSQAGCGITIPPESPNALADTLLYFRGLSQQERARIGAKGRAYVERVHDFPILGKRFLELVEGLINGNRAN